MVNYLDLFHGIGGFALGAYWAGMKFKNHFCSDIEPYCQELYKLRFPDSVQLGDIREIKAEDLPHGEWIITGGFPCQDISIAGKGAGIHGERSGLWFEYWRLIRDLRPRFAIMENVGMLVHRGLREVLGSLAEIGYNAEWQDIRASDMGAPHRRERIWIITYPDTASIGWTTGCNNERQHADNISEIGQTEKNKQSGNIGKCGAVEVCTDNVADTFGKRCKEQYSSGESKKSAFGGREIIENHGCKYGEARGQELGGLRGQLEERNSCNKFKRSSSTRIWDEAIESRIARMDDGVSRNLDSNRLRGLGNAIVPQIAEILFRQIREIL